MTPRNKILAFYGVPTTSSGTTTITYTRMKYFTQLSHAKNPQEYNRKYVDEENQRNDVTGYNPQYDYAFDRTNGDAVLEDILDITNNEWVGEDAVRTIILVDTETGNAIKRDYAVIPGSEGDDVNVYTHSGSMKAHGEKTTGTASSTDSWQTVTFTSSVPPTPPIPPEG